MRPCRQLTAVEFEARERHYLEQRARHRQAGAKLREARTLSDITVTDLAKRLGRRPGTIQSWETGQRPGPAIRDALCAELGLLRPYMELLWAESSWTDPRETETEPRGGKCPCGAPPDAPCCVGAPTP